MGFDPKNIETDHCGNNCGSCDCCSAKGKKTEELSNQQAKELLDNIFYFHQDVFDTFLEQHLDDVLERFQLYTSEEMHNKLAVQYEKLSGKGFI